MKLLLALVLAFSSITTLGFVQNPELKLEVSRVLQLTGNVIDWKVGDKAEYKISIPALPLPMGLSKEVTEDLGDSIWVVTEVTGIQPQTIETLIQKADGKIIKYIKNGVEEPAPTDSGIQIVSTSTDTVTVPAGTFDVVKVVAKTSDGYDLILWSNTNLIPMEGSAKQEITVDGVNMIIELTKYLKQ